MRHYSQSQMSLLLGVSPQRISKMLRTSRIEPTNRLGNRNLYTESVAKSLATKRSRFLHWNKKRILSIENASRRDQKALALSMAIAHGAEIFGQRTLLIEAQSYQHMDQAFEGSLEFDFSDQHEGIVRTQFGFDFMSHGHVLDLRMNNFFSMPLEDFFYQLVLKQSELYPLIVIACDREYRLHHRDASIESVLSLNANQFFRDNELDISKLQLSQMWIDQKLMFDRANKRRLFGAIQGILFGRPDAGPNCLGRNRIEARCSKLV